MSENNSNGGSCLKYFVIFFVLGSIGKYFGNTEESLCSVCGKYSYQIYRDSIDYNNSLYNEISEKRIAEFNKRVKDQPSAIYALTLSDPEKNEDNKIIGQALLGMEARYIGMIIYKGKFIITPDSKSVDGLIRIEKRYNDRTKDWDHITLLGYDNVIYFKIKGKDIILDSGPTDELGLFFKNATFIRD